VFEDMNADGVKQSNEPAYSGVVIYGDVNGNGKRDEGEPSTTSDGQGNYSLTIALGTTTIREETPSGGTCSFPTGCAYTVDLAKNSPPPPPDVNTRAVDPTGKDFGNWRPASVSGTVVNDANGNGVRDLGEAGVGGIQVYADLNGNGALDAGEPSTTSAADGSYTVAGLKPGGYVIRHVLPQGPTCTGPANCNYNLVLQSHSAEVSRNFFEMTPVITPAPEQLVLPERIIPGIARLVGKTGCISGTGFTARIRGVKMIRLIFFIDGTAAKAVTLPQDNQTYRYRVDIRKMRIGRHTLAVKVVYRTKTRTNSKTLRLTFQRCAAQLRAPAFTG
jgi:hypothetical protein